MSRAPEDWNPDDGPAPTDEERADAARLADALDRDASRAKPELAALVDTALRLRATVHPRPDVVRAVADRVTAEVLDRHASSARSPVAFLRRRWRPLAVAAAAVATLSVGGAQLLSRPGAAEPSISRVADDVFSSPLGAREGSTPSSRIYDARMHAWRDALLRGGRRR